VFLQSHVAPGGASVPDPAAIVKVPGQGASQEDSMTANRAYCRFGADRCGACAASAAEERRRAIVTASVTTRECGACGLQTPADGRFCKNCGAELPSLYDEADTAGEGIPVSSSGRQPDTSPEGRRRLLRAFSPVATFSRKAGGDWFARIADAQALEEQTAKDAEEAAEEMRWARHVIDTEHLAERSLDPAGRHRYMQLLSAEAAWEDAVTKAEKARAALSRLADQAPPALGDIPPGQPRSAVFRPKPQGLEDPGRLDYGAWLWQDASPPIRARRDGPRCWPS
jgi:hypothetical protein